MFHAACFTCYENMGELKREFLAFAFEYYERYTAEYGRTANAEPCLILPLSYIEFAKRETFLFRLLFISDMELDMKAKNDFYREIGNEEKARVFSEMIGVETERGKEIFADLFFYAHGIAVLAATGKLSLERRETESMLLHVLRAWTAFRDGGEDGNKPVFD